MTIPFFTQEEFIAFLKKHKFDTASDEHWDDYKRIVIKKEGVTFSFQLKKTYSFIIVCELCADFNIEPPEEHLKPYLQWQEQKNKLK